jgi:thiamine monophosphate synthase
MIKDDKARALKVMFKHDAKILRTVAEILQQNVDAFTNDKPEGFNQEVVEVVYTAFKRGAQCVVNTIVDLAQSIEDEVRIDANGVSDL